MQLDIDDGEDQVMLEFSPEGSSPKTYQALKDLFIAMCEDQVSGGVAGKGHLRVHPLVREMLFLDKQEDMFDD